MADDYACLFPSMIRSWRQNFNRPDAFFGYVQLSTWCPGQPNVTWPSWVMGYMRDVQLLAQSSPFSAYATNADHGAGCDVHPPSKQFCAKRLAASALAIVYQKPIAWRSPSYIYAVSPTNGVLTVWLNDVSPAGLVQIDVEIAESSARIAALRSPAQGPQVEEDVFGGDGDDLGFGG